MRNLSEFKLQSYTDNMTALFSSTQLRERCDTSLEKNKQKEWSNIRKAEPCIMHASTAAESNQSASQNTDFSTWRHGHSLLLPNK